MRGWRGQRAFRQLAAAGTKSSALKPAPPHCHPYCFSILVSPSMLPSTACTAPSLAHAPLLCPAASLSRPRPLRASDPMLTCTASLVLRRPASTFLVWPFPLPRYVLLGTLTSQLQPPITPASGKSRCLALFRTLNCNTKGRQLTNIQASKHARTDTERGRLQHDAKDPLDLPLQRAIGSAPS